MKDFYRPAEVASMLSVDVRRVRKWIAEGDLEHIRLGERDIRIKPAAVKDLLERRRCTANGSIDDQDRSSTGLTSPALTPSASTQLTFSSLASVQADSSGFEIPIRHPRRKPRP